MAAPARVYFLTSRSQWNGYVLAGYALSGAAGLLGAGGDLPDLAPRLRRRDRVPGPRRPLRARVPAPGDCPESREYQAQPS
ncbi:MAG: hypothetical protein ABSA53_36250 [Streptosporangiaceae bacterium]|jgi:hypothetical protein